MSQKHFVPVVIRASAGTGKTFQLTNRFIGLAVGDEAFDSILATTFTRKAAGEILDRVLVRLAEATADKKKLAELARHAEQASLDRTRCLEVLHGMLRQLHRLRVGTLDSFFMQVARSFSLELGFPPGWQIVDELVDQRLRGEAIQNVLAGEATHDVLALMHLLTKGEAARSVSQQIRELVNDLYGLYLEAPPEAWKALVRPKPLTAEELEAAIEALAEAPLPGGTRYSKVRDQDLESARSEDWPAFLGKGLGAKIVDGTEEYFRKPIPDEVLAVYRPLVDHARAILVNQIANQTEATHKLLERFDTAYQPLKIAHRALRFEDITRKLAVDGVKGRVDQIGFRLDARLAHLLLDEFQDTSPLQWLVLRPFAERVARADGGDSFFCVGDVKQAIYGWRGGVAEIFDAIGDQLPNLTARSLDESRRSCQPVIDTVNRVFEAIAGNAALAEHGDAAQGWQERFQTHTTALSELPGYCRLATDTGPTENDAQAMATLRFAAAEVARLHREAPGRTIGVLTRRNKAVAALIAFLRELGVEASEEGGNPLIVSPAVEVVLSLLTLADHPGDSTARFHVAHSPLGAAVGLTRHDDVAAAERLSREVRRELMANGYGPTLYRWAKMLAPSCDGRDLNRLLQLVEMGYGYEPQATTRADAFVAMVTETKVEDPTAADVRVMTIHQAKGLQFEIVVLPELDQRVTAQPPRIVAGRPGPTERVERICRYVKKELRPLLPEEFARMFREHERLVVEESLCLLYVAMTRAVHGLYMIVAPSGEKEKSIPASFAGVLRAALTDGQKAEPGTVLFEHGDAGWIDAAAKRSPKAACEEAAPPEPLVVRLAPATPRAARGLERKSPSQLEGGSQVRLAHRLRLDTREALDRGTLMHAWFEQIGWLEDGEPDEAVLREVAGDLALGGFDISELISQFRQMLGRPAVRAVLSRSGYEQAARSSAGVFAAIAGLTQPRWEVERERSFAVRDADAILSGQIDRLVVLYDGPSPVAAEVIDFKTDAVPKDDPKAIEARVEVYRPQLEAYRRAVGTLLGLDASRVSARLVFVEPGVVSAV
ncbi:MAG: UvrD-helicase domain-containing protein [Pirellulales bacterium]